MEFKKCISELTVEYDKVLKKKDIDDLPQTENASQSSVKTTPKIKSASPTFKTSARCVSKTSSQRQRELLHAIRLV